MEAGAGLAAECDARTAGASGGGLRGAGGRRSLPRMADVARPTARRRRRIAAAIAVAVVAAIAWSVAWPLGYPTQPSGARSAPAAALHPECAAFELDHGRRTPRAWVLLHGLTSCPRQFRRLADSLYARGDNVVVPRLPRHGEADRMTPALAGLTAAELTAACDTALARAATLGERVEVMGLSLGGALAGWAAQERDVDRAVLLAPMFAAHGVPAWLDRFAVRALTWLPNRFAWWDDDAREALAGPRATYPRFASRALGHALWIGGHVIERARAAPPRARSIVIVTTPDDRAARTSATAAVVREWRAHGARVTVHTFADSLGIEHDFVDPEQPYARVAVSYDHLLRWIDAGQ